MTEELDFNPFPIIKGSFAQTILGSIPHLKKGPKSVTKFIALPDKDYLAVEITTPKKWKKTDPTIVLVHGLCGSHKSPILVRLAKKFKSKNIRSVRVNLRGCGSGRGKAKKLYHGGQSSDIFEVLKVLKNEHPLSDITLIGFSLGGNISLKLAGELSIEGIDILKKVIAINPPVDLLASVKRLDIKENRIYQKYFVKLLKEDLEYRKKIFPELNEIEFPEDITFFQWDELYTTKAYGFDDVLTYYKKSSSKTLVPSITMPCHILFSDDDPIIKSQTFDNYTLPKNVRLFKTKNGGHIGYIGFPKKFKGLYWIDNVIVNWALEE
ncbi:MAG: 2-succinyl-6-hydroxy-2,4-cyclohexadiene-1-carboxylate synthase [Candidatus Anoxychlamydiales bacterium]|nr:2-succinyl-6-hydroxy-2,4-cyclohexadiene-1-carboxylate synthase [Candidatus Anoxychlamydiales bacterium]